ncbi:MAG: glycosyltransferase family 2 protein [Chlamydiales bacterium]|nr:glycosyltransferase family 2 protein [Chlamydiales bacterium]
MISVTILVKNGEATLQKTLESLSSFPEVLLYDSGSTDSTLEIAKNFSNVRIHNGEFIGFGPTHNVASNLASYDWILSIDSDEQVTPELSAEILSSKLDPIHVYEIRRHNFFSGKRIKGCSGWDPDYVVRLYNRKQTSFDNAQVHEKVMHADLKKITLKNPLLHFPYLQIGDFLTKMQSYSSLFAIQHKNSKRASFGSALAHSWWAFVKSYIFKRGFLAGREGLIISLYNAHTTLYKYLKLAEAQQKARCGRDFSNEKSL